MAEHIVKRRLDYEKPDFLISETALTFDLFPEKTVVTSVLLVKRQNTKASHITLDGEELCLVSVSVNDKALSSDEYELNASGLKLCIDCDSVELKIVTEINPKQNTSLEGLYYTQDAYCTQCEAEGFRKITYYLDRPDVLSIFTVTIRTTDAPNKYLLSNGNLVKRYKEGDTDIAVWHDPHPKPSYLFALVAGDFDLLVDTFITRSGRAVNLELYLEKGRLQQGQHALDSLKKAMKWDEDTYGLEYDLDVYMVVAVDFFNMGAMENKGLNVFNSKFVLADAKTATDEDFFNIESIIAHEYFHNWTGNRVTCRDWFQLSLKEGLTVFRDQQFSADMSSYLSTRISQVKVMREHQFVEDTGPMSHPIRPDEVMEMNNFYTVTVYDKGAEVIRMLHTLLSAEGFRKGMDLYFARHDGEAVTCDDFVDAMATANNMDLQHFRQWYSQSGTPLIAVSKKENDLAATTEFTFTQVNPKTADQKEKSPLFVPIVAEFLDTSGKVVDAPNLTNSSIIVNEQHNSFSVEGTNLTPVLLDKFSAPVVIDYDYSIPELLHIIRYASSSYAKWDASQRVFSACIQARYAMQISNATPRGDKLINNRNTLDVQGVLSEYAKVLVNADIEGDVLVELLSLPSTETARTGLKTIDPIAFEDASEYVQKSFAEHIGGHALACLSASQVAAYQYSVEQVNQRALNASWLKLAVLNENTRNAALLEIEQRYIQSDNMTDRLNCLKVCQIENIDLFDKLMSSFEQEFGHDAVIMDKWFGLHATTKRVDILAQLDLLRAHGQFTINNPNKVRALIGSFAFYNTLGFHQKHGAGYKYLGDYLLDLDKVNPQVASRIVTPLLQFESFNEPYKSLMKSQIERIFTSKGLSRDLFEKASKALTSSAN